MSGYGAKCGWVLAAAILLAGLAIPARGDGVTVTAAAQEPAVVRQTPAGEECLVYLSIGNPAKDPLTGLKLFYQVGHRAVEREILDVPPGGAMDTVWVPEPAPASLHAWLFRKDEVLWSGNLTVAAAGSGRVLIPRSPCLRVEDLKPLMLRGTNYFPRVYPWPGIWRHMDEAAFEAEFAEMKKLHINTIRTFFIHDPEAGLQRKDGTFLPVVLSRINTLLKVADRRRVKVMLCLIGGAGAPYSDLAFWRRYFRTSIEPFAYDGRILMWDLINEPGGGDGPKATPELAGWIQVMFPELQQLAPNHTHTVGLAWQFDQLWDLGVKPPVAQYHNYSGAVGVQPAGKPRVRNVADDLRTTAKLIGNRPLVIGEFGYATVVDDVRKDASEERQLEICRGVIEGADAAVASGVNLVGIYNWCAFHYQPDWMGKGEQSFGIIKLDGTLKPAGVLIRDTYARWSTKVKAPWE